MTRRSVSCAALSSSDLLGRADEWGYSLNLVIKALESLFDTYGVTKVEHAVTGDCLGMDIRHAYVNRCH